MLTLKRILASVHLAPALKSLHRLPQDFRKLHGSVDFWKAGFWSSASFFVGGRGEESLADGSYSEVDDYMKELAAQGPSGSKFSVHFPACLAGKHEDY